MVELSGPEERLWRAVTCGTRVDLRTGNPELDDPGRGEAWGPDRVIRAEVIAALVLRSVPVEDGNVPSLRLIGARVSGKLDLSFARLVCPVELEGCTFDEGVTLEEATTASVRLVRCRIPYLEAGTITVQGHLELTGSQLGWLDVYGARISTELDLCDVLLSGPRANAVNAELLRLDGSLYADRLTAQGPINLVNAHIAGEVRFDGARLRHPSGDALAGEQLTVGGNLLCRGATVDGSVRLLGAQIGGSLDLSRARLTKPGGKVLYAARLRLGVDLIGIDGFTAVGEIRLHGARIEGAISFQGARMDNSGGRALNAYRLG
ncbi:MAG TPA: hypothetical protein VJX66_18860, partial [Amycolatopsis sp.]|nr:hypothetical protein [Amycolatopsis sp.]